VKDLSVAQLVPVSLYIHKVSFFSNYAIAIHLKHTQWAEVHLLEFVCLFDYLQPPEQFFSYPAAVTITGDGAANLDLCLALMGFSSEGSFSCHTYCDTLPRFIRSHPKDHPPPPEYKIYALLYKITSINFQIYEVEFTLWCITSYISGK
jgi:hypothetical protein